MTISIYINSVEALERLIGGDNDLEIGIRQDVVDAFTKKHLKEMASSVSAKLMTKIAEESIERLIGRVSGSSVTVVPEFRQVINSMVKESFEQVILQAKHSCWVENIELVKELKEYTVKMLKEHLEKFSFQAVRQAVIKEMKQKKTNAKLLKE